MYGLDAQRSIPGHLWRFFHQRVRHGYAVRSTGRFGGSDLYRTDAVPCSSHRFPLSVRWLSVCAFV